MGAVTRELWQTMQSAPAPALVTLKPAATTLVSPSTRSSVECGSWHVWQVWECADAVLRPIPFR